MWADSDVRENRTTDGGAKIGVGDAAASCELKAAFARISPVHSKPKEATMGFTFDFFKDSKVYVVFAVGFAIGVFIF